MKKLILLPFLALTISGVGCKNDASAPAATQAKAPETLQEKQAYSVGTRMAKSHKQVVDEIVGVEGEGNFDVEMYLLGVRDTLSGDLKLTEEEMETISEEYRKVFLEKKRAADDAKKAENQKAAADFLAENKTKEGVIETESGLQYKVITATEGTKPVKGDKVQVLYTGKLITGEVFDTTSEDNQTREFDITRVVKGWTEGLQLMSEGSKFEFYIPPELGYGDRDMSTIPAGSVLVFEVELVKVVPAAKPEDAAAEPAAAK